MKETLQILRYSTPIRVILGSIVAVPIIIGVLMILLTGQGLLTHVDYGIADPSLLGH